MEKKVYINRITSYLPNKPISNDEMEDYIGMIGGKPSRVRSIVLRQNGIKTRYYGLDKEHKITHSNAQLAKEAVVDLFADRVVPTDVTLLALWYEYSRSTSALPCLYGAWRARKLPDGDIFLGRCMSHFPTSTEDLLQ